MALFQCKFLHTHNSGIIWSIFMEQQQNNHQQMNILVDSLPQLDVQKVCEGHSKQLWTIHRYQ